MTLYLTPIRGDSPIGYMAALGLLQIAPEDCRLAWDPVTQVAQFEGIEADDLLTHLVGHMRGRHARPELGLTANGDVRGVEAGQFKEMVRDASLETLDWIRCWWRQEGQEIHPTDLCLTGGPQRFFKMAVKLAEILDPERRKGAVKKVWGHFQEALFGPWSYSDGCTSWGWDPLSYRPGAITHQAPTVMKPEGVAGAYWLAWESQLFFPCLPGHGTLGFERRPRRWSWSTWAMPLDRHAVKALLRQPEEAVALGGRRFQSRINMAGQFQFMMPGRAI